MMMLPTFREDCPLHQLPHYLNMFAHAGLSQLETRRPTKRTRRSV